MFVYVELILRISLLMEAVVLIVCLVDCKMIDLNLYKTSLLIRIDSSVYGVIFCIAILECIAGAVIYAIMGNWKMFATGWLINMAVGGLVVAVYEAIMWNLNINKQYRKHITLIKLRSDIQNVINKINKTIADIKQTLEDNEESSEIYKFLKVKQNKLNKTQELLQILGIEVKLKLDTESLSKLNKSFEKLNIQSNLSEGESIDELQKSFDYIQSLNELNSDFKVSDLIKKYN